MDREDSLYGAFSYFDKDGSGSITLNEIQQSCKELGMDDAQVEEIIKEADIRNLLKDGPNNIVTKIGGKDITIRAFLKNDHLLSYDGFVGLSKRKVDNIIYI